jgi:hypothetical protein
MQNKKSTRYFSSTQEKKVAKAVKGKTVSNSGAPLFVAGDVQSDKWLFECKTKTSDSQSISIKREWLEKLEEEKFSMGKEHCALCFDFGVLQNSERYYIN